MGDRADASVRIIPPREQREGDLALAKLQKPELADAIEQATHITQASSAQAKMERQQLVVAVAYFVGEQNKDAGAIILASIMSAGLEAYAPERISYSASTFQMPYQYVADTAMVEPTISQGRELSGAIDREKGAELYDIVPGERNGREFRAYDSFYVTDPISGEDRYSLWLTVSRPK